METVARVREWSNEHRSFSPRGFTLIELLLTVVILGALGAMTSVALAGFDDAASSISCPSDTTQLKRAESTFFRQQARYGSESDLVGAGLLEEPSDLHDITASALSYSISETGRCVGSNTTYNLAAPTVGTSTQAGATVAVMNPDGTPVAGAVISYSQGTWAPMGTTDATGQVNVALADGEYDFRVVLRGTTNTLDDVAVTQGILITFPTVRLSVDLVDATGAPLAGGIVSVRSSGGSTSSLGTTSTTGNVAAQILPAIYDVSMSYAGRSITRTGVAVNAPTTITFQTHTLTVRLEYSDSRAPLAGGVVTATQSGGTQYALGTTNASGVVVATLLNGQYTVAMTYNGVTTSQSVSVNASTTVVFTAPERVTATLRMLASTGTGLHGQDGAMWYRASGGSSWIFAGYPNAGGTVSFSAHPGTYDFRARWFGQHEVKLAVAIASGTVVTFQTVPATESIRTSTGTALSGQDAAFWVRPAGTATWYFSGYPNGSGEVVQQLLNGSYEFRTQWLGTLEVSPTTAVSGPATVTFQAAGISITARRTSDNSVVSGATVSVITGNTNYSVGTTDATGQYVAQVLVSTVGVRCTLSPITGANSNLVVPSGGISTTVMLA